MLSSSLVLNLNSTLVLSFKALIDAHDRFKTVLEEARYDFDELKASDDSIKSLNMAANPYTWFTMETLFDTWKSLEKLIRVCQLRLYFYY